MTPALLALGLASVLPALLLWRRPVPPRAWRDLAARTGADLRGDGTLEPLRLFGVLDGRRWTVIAQRDQASLAVDCATSRTGDVPVDGRAAVPSDGALVLRLEPADPARIEALVAALAHLAAELEREAPGEGEDEH